MEKTEVWKSIPNFEFYEVSNYGRVRSVSHIIRQCNGRSKKVKGRILHQWQNHQGYLEVTLYHNGIHKHFRVNRLVAMVFLNNPDNLPEVNHLDEIKKNNTVWNLEYTTHRDNLQYSYFLHRNDPDYKKRHKKVKGDNNYDGR